MRSISRLCLLFLVAISLPAPSQTVPEPETYVLLQGRTLTDKAYGFSIDLPGEGWEWQEMENPHGRSLAVTSPDGTQLLSIAAGDQLLEGVQDGFIEGYVQGLRGPLERSGSTVEDVRHEPSQIPFEGSHRVVMKIRMADGVERTFFGYVAPARRLYSMHAFSADGAEPPDLRPLAASFKLLEPATSPGESPSLRTLVFYSYLVLLGIVMGIGWIVNKILGRPKVNGARIAFVLIALLAAIRLLGILVSFESGGDPGLQGEAIGRWTAETAIALLIAHFLARHFKKKAQQAALAKASVETFS